MKKYIIILFLVFPLHIFSTPVDIDVKENSVTIRIESLNEYFQQSKLLNYNYLHFAGINNVSPFIIDSTALDKLKFTLALPVNGTYSFDYKVNETKLIEFGSKAFKSSFVQQIEINPIGYQRGVKLAIVSVNPFSFDNISGELKLIESAEITVTFNQEIGLSKFSPANPEFKFFSNVLNSQQIPTILSQTAFKKKSNEKTQSEDWYNPAQKYVRITTTEDRLAKIDASGIISIENSFTNKSTKYFHLLFKGEEQPIYFSNDIDSLLNTGDAIIFIGHRAEGDTTWFDNYTDSATFFLYYDESFEGNRFNQFPVLQEPSKELSFVKFDRHLEKDLEYFHGTFNYQWIVENLPREGWQWKTFASNNSAGVSFEIPYFALDSLALGINIKSLNWNEEKITKHNLQLIFNNDSLNIFSIDTGKINYIKKNISNENLVTGINELKIKNIGNFDTNSKLLVPDITSIDFLTLQGNTLPFAYNGIADFSIPKQSEDFLLKVPNFKGNIVVLVDKISNSIKELSGVKGTSILIGTKSKNSPYTSLIINDSVFVSNSAGLHIAVVKAPQYTDIEFTLFKDNMSGALDYINNLIDGSLISVAYNSNQDIPANLRSKLQSLGSSEINNLNSGDCWVFFARTNDVLSVQEKLSPAANANLTVFFEHQSGETYRVKQGLKAEADYNLIMSDLSNLEIAQISTVKSSLLKNENHKADAIFITHKKFKNSADSLADYRRAQGYAVEVVDVDDIYKEFNSGRKSPHAIKNFLRYAYNYWQKPAPQFVLLIGDADWDARNHIAGSVNIDYVPTYGWPPSDFWYSCLDSGLDYVHELYIGRIPAVEETDVLAVLNKIRQYDSLPQMPWMKTFLSLTGGDPGNKENFKESMDNMLSAYWLVPPLCGDTMVVAKRGNETVGLAEAGEIISKIDKGAVWVNFFGHGSPQVFDMDGWQGSKLNNKGKYSFFTTISCNTGAFAEPEGTARNEDYLILPEKGFIATGGSTSVGIELPGMQILTYMMEILTDTNSSQRTFGEILQNAKIKMVDDDLLTKSFAQQYVLLGDPLTRIRIPAKPEFFIAVNDVAVTNYYENKILIESDSVAKIEGFIYNAGFNQSNVVHLVLIHKYKNEYDTIEVNINGICLKEWFRFDSLMISKRLGEHSYQIFSKKDDSLSLLYSGSFDVYPNGLLALDPLPFWNVDGANLHFRVINPKMESNQKYEFLITTLDEFNGERIIYSYSDDEVLIRENYVDWIPNKIIQDNSNYYFYGRIISTIDTVTSQWLRVPFSTQNISLDTVRAVISKDFLKLCKITGLDFTEPQSYSSFDFNRIVKDYKIISARGNAEVTRYNDIIYDGGLYVNTTDPSQAPVGMNLVIVDGKNGNYITTRKYNTWDGENSTRDLVTFLNDTVSDGDLLLLGVCGSGWRMFYHTGLKDKEAIGGFNSFKSAINRFGGVIVQQITDTNDIPRISYAVSGRKGFPIGTANEKITFDGGIVTIEDSLIINNNSATFKTPEISVAKAWQNLEVNSEINASAVSSTLSLYGLQKDNNESLLGKYSDYENIDLSGISASVYPKLRAELEFEKIAGSSNFKLNNFTFNFIPAAELALLRNSSGILQDSLLRWDTADVKYWVENISLRSESEKNKLTTSLSNFSGNIRFDTLDVDIIKRDDSLLLERRINTNNLDFDNKIKLNANFDSTVNEVYYFNNQNHIPLILSRDKVIPWVKVYCDGVEIQSGAYASFRPIIQIELFDNSYEPVNEEAINVKINSETQDQSSADKYILDLLNTGHLKARASFLPDSLINHDNRLELFISDAAGNKDTVEYQILTLLNAFLLNLKNNPNPFGEFTTFNFEYRAPDNSGLAVISIYDINGKIVRQLNSGLRIGENEVKWDCLDEYGNAVSDGMYLYIIQIVSENYSDPGNGQMLKLR